VQRTAILTSFCFFALCGSVVGLENTSARIANECARHAAVLKEIQYSREQAADALKYNEAVCKGDANCTHAQRLNYVRELDQQDVLFRSETKQHALIMKNILPDIGPDSKAKC
jgi:hypothetical protein